MKKIFITLLLFTASITIEAQNITTFTEATTLAGTDLFYLARSPFTSTYDRKLSWSTLAAAIDDSTGGFAYIASTKLGVTNTMYSDQVFEGPATVTFLGPVTATNAKFLIPNITLYTDWKHFGYAGSSGSSYLCFNYGASLGQRDTMLTTRRLRTGLNSDILPSNTNTYTLGTAAKVWNKVYSDTFIVGTWSIWHTDTTINITGPIHIISGTDTTLIDGSSIKSIGGGAVNLSGYALSEKPYSFSATADSVIDMDVDEPPSSILITSSVSVSGCDSLYMPKAINGQMVIITNDKAFSVVLQDSYKTSDGNFDLASSFTMGEDDVITLKYNATKHAWIEVSRSNN